MASLPSVLSFIKRSNAFILSRTLATVRVSSSGYVPFCRAQHPLLKKADPTLKFGDIAKKIGAMWKTLSDDKKQVAMFSQDVLIG